MIKSFDVAVTRAERGVHPGEPFAFSVRRDATRLAVRVHGDLDLASEPTLRMVAGPAAASGCAEIVIDLRGVTFLDPTGVRAIMQIAQDAAANCAEGVRLTVLATSSLRRVFGALGELPFELLAS